jgi:hypothetical protein
MKSINIETSDLCMLAAKKNIVLTVVYTTGQRNVHNFNSYINIKPTYFILCYGYVNIVRSFRVE